MSATDFEKQWGIPARNVGLVADNDTRDRAVIARAGGNIYRRAAFARFDPLRCRYQDCGEGHPFALDDERTTCPVCRDDQGLPPISESELRAMHGDR